MRYTIASTSQMVDAQARRWAHPLLIDLGLPDRLLQPLVEPANVVGALRGDVNQTYAGVAGCGAGCHDTASAFAAVERDGGAFLSSGTWSLLGAELDAPIVTPAARDLNFTNEGGVCGTTRVSRISAACGCCRRACEPGRLAVERHSYDELLASAADDALAFGALSIRTTARSSIRPTCPPRLQDSASGRVRAPAKPGGVHTRRPREPRVQVSKRAARTRAVDWHTLFACAYRRRRIAQSPAQSVHRQRHGAPRDCRTGGSDGARQHRRPDAGGRRRRIAPRGSSHHQAVVSRPNVRTDAHGAVGPSVPIDSRSTWKRRRRKHRVVAVSSHAEQHLDCQLIEALVGKPFGGNRAAIDRATEQIVAMLLRVLRD